MRILTINTFLLLQCILATGSCIGGMQFRYVSYPLQYNQQRDHYICKSVIILQSVIFTPISSVIEYLNNTQTDHCKHRCPMIPYESIFKWCFCCIDTKPYNPNLIQNLLLFIEVILALFESPYSNTFLFIIESLLWSWKCTSHLFIS